MVQAWAWCNWGSWDIDWRCEIRSNPAYWFEFGWIATSDSNFNCEQSCHMTLRQSCGWSPRILLVLWLQCHISKKHIRLGGMAVWHWKNSFGAVTDNPGEDYSAPGVNTTCRAAYRPPISVSPLLLAWSVSYCKQTLWRCGQLWPYVGMGFFGYMLTSGLQWVTLWKSVITFLLH